MAARRWLGLAAIWAIPALATASHYYVLSNVVFDEQTTLAGAMLAKLPPWLLWLAATPLIVRLRRRSRLAVPSIAAHVALAAALAVCDTVLGIWCGALAEQVPYRDYPMSALLVPLLLKGAFFELSIYGAVIAADLGLEYHDRYRESALRESRLEARLAETHLDALKAQLRPHFLFNTLNAISVLARKGAATGVVKMIDGLSELLRRSLTAARAERIPLAEELDFVQHYLDIATTRFPDRIRTRIDVPAAARGLLVPSLLLQPLVENAIEHGLAPRVDGGELAIIARVAGDCLRLEVRDDGVGLDAARPFGLGLSLVRDRLAQLYAGRQRFALEPGAPGTVAIVELPVERVHEGS